MKTQPSLASRKFGWFVFEENVFRDGFALKSDRAAISMSSMLTISSDILPNNLLTYVAFRVACLDTLERLTLSRQFEYDSGDSFGYLTEVPFLRSVAPQVQLDLLSATWQKIQTTESVVANLVDESVVFAACETTARLVELDPAQVRRWLLAGPRKETLPLAGLRSDLRGLHLSLLHADDCLLLGQFEDLPPLESLRLKAHYGLEPRRCEAMLEALSRWSVFSGFAGRLNGLLTDREIRRAMAVVQPISCRI